MLRKTHNVIRTKQNWHPRTLLRVMFVVLACVWSEAQILHAEEQESPVDVYDLPTPPKPKRGLLSNKPAPKLHSEVLQKRLKRFLPLETFKQLPPKDLQLLCRASDLWDIPRHDKQVEAAYRHLMANCPDEEVAFLARVYLAEFLLRNARIQEGRELLKNQEPAVAAHPIFSRSYMEQYLPSVVGVLDVFITYRENIHGKIDYYREINSSNIRFMLMDPGGTAIRNAKPVVNGDTYCFADIKPGKYRVEVFWKVANTFHRTDYQVEVKPDEQAELNLGLRFLRLSGPADGTLFDPRATIPFSWQVAVLKGVYGAEVIITDLETHTVLTLGGDEWIRGYKTSISAANRFFTPGHEYSWVVQAVRLEPGKPHTANEVEQKALRSATWHFRINEN